MGQGHLVETGDSVVSSSLHHGTLCVYVGQGHLVKFLMCPCGTKALSGAKAIFPSLQCVHVGTRALSENSLCVYVGTRTLSEKVGQKNGLIFVIRRCRGANEFIIVYNCLACQYPS